MHPTPFLFFPVAVPPDFRPIEVKPPLTAAGKVCPQYAKGAPYAPGWGGGFTAPRGPRRLKHAALDIMACRGSTVRAPCAIEIVESFVVKAGDVRKGAGWSEKGGYYAVGWSEEHGLELYFAHMLGAPIVSPGERLEAGQPIGMVGATGNATRTVHTSLEHSEPRGCPHLHFRVQRGRSPRGKKIDPRPLLEPVFATWREGPFLGWHGETTGT